MLRILSVIAAAIALSPVQAAAAPSPGVTITLTCEIGTVGTGTFKVTANGSSSLVTVPCGGSATATNSSWTAGTMATIDQTAGPVYSAGNQPACVPCDVRRFVFYDGACLLAGIYS